MHFKAIIFQSAAIALLLTAGCDQPKAPDKTASTPPSAQYGPATRPADHAMLASTVIPAATRPAQPPVATAPTSISFIIYERGTAADPGTLYSFPLARAHFDRDADTVVLYSDDPKEAIRPEYAGNSFYLTVPLNQAGADKLDNYQWDYRAASASQHEKSTEGIFLFGQREYLAPADMHVALQSDGPNLKFVIWGQFVKYDKSNDVQGRLGVDVNVQTNVQRATIDPQK